MCGICAVVGPNVNEDTKAALQRMIAALSHRGPDARGELIQAGCQLGHARLSIIDLVSGSQPMKDISGRYCITFNGEIYNYQALRNELMETGYTFDTHSDTEVVMSAYDKWGHGCLDKFRGMFAFAIWDTREQRLFAGRDLFGEKPLYYAKIPDGSIIIASEIKSLIASKLLAPKLDLRSVDAFLGFGYIPPDRTVYANVHTLPPGHFLEWDQNNVKINRYWYPKFDTHPISLDDAAERLRELLQQAVKRQMVADVPVGAFLSGGHDSSTIVALMQKMTNHPVKTFSVSFGKYIDETPYANLVAKLYHTEHHVFDFGTPPVGQLLKKMARVYDEPFRDFSHIPTFLISQYARENVKVVLTGDGADELFGGYGWYPVLNKSTEVSPSRLKYLVLRSVSRLLGHRIAALEEYSRAVALAVRHPQAWMRNVSSVTIGAAERQAWWGERLAEVGSYSPGDYFKPMEGTKGMNEVLQFDLLSFLPGDILVKVDRASMAHGLETRAPFLDRDVAEFALSLPSSLKVKNNETKILFKHACKEYWPSELQTRGKQGFDGPYKIWLGFQEVEMILKRVFSKEGKLRRLLPGLADEQISIKNYATWNLMTLGLWLDNHDIVV